MREMSLNAPAGPTWRIIALLRLAVMTNLRVPKLHRGNGRLHWQAIERSECRGGRVETNNYCTTV